MTKMTIDRATVEQALEALGSIPCTHPAHIRRRDEAYDALEAALTAPTGKQDLQVEPAIVEIATTQQQVAHTPPSEYRRGYWDGFNIGKREGRIEAEDALAQLAEPVQEPVNAERLFTLAHLWAKEAYFKGLGRPCDIDGARVALENELKALVQQAEPVQEHAEQMAKLGWQYFECPACGSEGARAFPKPVQEPVAWYFEARHVDSAWAAAVTLKHPGAEGVYMRKVTSLYTAPPQRKPLTDEEIKAKAMEAFNSYWDGDDETLVNKYGHGVYLSRFIEFARAVEAAHGIKENT